MGLVVTFDAVTASLISLQSCRLRSLTSGSSPEHCKPSAAHLNFFKKRGCRSEGDICRSNGQKEASETSEVTPCSSF